MTREELEVKTDVRNATRFTSRVKRPVSNLYKCTVAK